MGIGIESGSKFVRDGVEKGRFYVPEIISIVEKIRNHGIYVAANYISGLPDDTNASMQETLDLAIDLNTEWAHSVFKSIAKSSVSCIDALVSSGRPEI